MLLSPKASLAASSLSRSLLVALLVSVTLWHIANPAGAAENSDAVLPSFFKGHFEYTPTVFATWPVVDHERLLNWNQEGRWLIGGDVPTAIRVGKEFGHLTAVKDISSDKVWAEIEERKSRPHHVWSCDELFWSFGKYGLNGASLIVPMNQWHMLSQVAGDYIRKTGSLENTPFCPAYEELGTGNLVTKSTFNAMGIMHGAAWHMVRNLNHGNPNETTWELLSTLCPHVSFMFPHGVGHGLVTSPTGACEKVPIIDDFNRLLPGLNICLKMP
jgi:hypothetical protein